MELGRFANRSDSKNHRHAELRSIHHSCFQHCPICISACSGLKSENHLRECLKRVQRSAFAPQPPTLGDSTPFFAQSRPSRF